MIIHLEKNVGERGLERVLERLQEHGKPKSELRIMHGDTYVIGVLHDASQINESHIQEMEEVANVVRLTKKWKALSRDMQPEDTTITLPQHGVEFGADLVYILGPCAVESYEQLRKSADIVKDAGGRLLRGGHTNHVPAVLISKDSKKRDSHYWHK